MKPTDPLLLRCLALTGSFETGKLPPDCFSAIAGDFDGQGISFSCLQWNIGQGTLQPLLREMIKAHPDVMARCFGSVGLESLSGMLVEVPAQPNVRVPVRRPVQVAWARSIQGSISHVLNPDWKAGFSALGETPEWQSIAQVSAAVYFDQARFLASQLKLRSDRAMALLFDCCVQNGGIPNLAMRHLQSLPPPEPDEHAFMSDIAVAAADVSNPRYRVDVLERKMTIANGMGVVHGLRYNLAEDFAL